jgi:hypothetical protein
MQPDGATDREWIQLSDGKFEMKSKFMTERQIYAL